MSPASKLSGGTARSSGLAQPRAETIAWKGITWPAPGIIVAPTSFICGVATIHGCAALTSKYSALVSRTAHNTSDSTSIALAAPAHLRPS
jgi:hypothetical protein